MTIEKKNKDSERKRITR